MSTDQKEAMRKLANDLREKAEGAENANDLRAAAHAYETALDGHFAEPPTTPQRTFLAAMGRAQEALAAED
jgi:hypothetical protein